MPIALPPPDVPPISPPPPSVMPGGYFGHNTNWTIPPRVRDDGRLDAYTLGWDQPYNANYSGIGPQPYWGNPFGGSVAGGSINGGNPSFEWNGNNYPAPGAGAIPHDTGENFWSSTPIGGLAHGLLSLGRGTFMDDTPIGRIMRSISRMFGGPQESVHDNASSNPGGDQSGEETGSPRMGGGDPADPNANDRIGGGNTPSPGAQSRLAMFLQANPRLNNPTAIRAIMSGGTRRQVEGSALYNSHLAGLMEMGRQADGGRANSAPINSEQRLPETAFNEQGELTLPQFRGAFVGDAEHPATGDPQDPLGQWARERDNIAQFLLSLQNNRAAGRWR